MKAEELAELAQTLPKDNEGAVRYEDIVLALNIKAFMEGENAREV